MADILQFTTRKIDASLEPIHEEISVEGMIGFEGLAPRELVAQFCALIEHHNRTARRFGNESR